MAISVLLWIYRFVHIMAGVAWVGGVTLWSLVVAPRLLANGPPQIRRPVLEAIVDALPRYYAAVGGTTLLFGVLLLGQMYGWDAFFSTLQAGTYGTMLGLGILLAVLMLILGFGVIKPTSHKMLKIMQSQPPGPPSADAAAQLGALGKRMAMASIGTLALGVLAIAAMTWAVSTHIGL